MRYDQQGCYSPHVFYVQRGGAVSPRAFAGYLAGELAQLARRFPRRPLDVEESAAVAGWRQALEWRGGSRAGEQGQFAATVANEGADRLAGTATLELDGGVLRTWEVALEPEENLTLLAEWTTEPGRHAVTILLELEQEELELANNQLALNLTISGTKLGGPPLLALAAIALGVGMVAVTAFFYWKRPPGKRPGGGVPLSPAVDTTVAEESVEAIVVEDDAWRRQD